MPGSTREPRRLTCLSAFSGLGGMDLGLEAAGFAHLGCIEWEESARRSLKANRADEWRLIEPGDIEAAAIELEPSDVGIGIAELDLLVGAPPCQPYSKAAQWVPSGRQGLQDRRGRYIDDFLTILERFLPKVILLENVRGFVQGPTSAIPHIETRLAAVAERTGMRYRLEHKVVDAVDYGVPQRRSRAIVVITRLDHPFTWPKHAATTVAWDAIGDLKRDDEQPSLRGKWANLLPTIPEGNNYLWHTDRGKGQPIFGYRTRYWSFLLKLAKNQPSWTLIANPGPSTGPFHWDNRPLSIRELLRLQSFPAEWAVEGSTRVERVRQVGNATPPLLAEALGCSVKAHIEDNPVPSQDRRLAIPMHRPVPRAARTSALSAEYLSLVGDHPAHPGHGKGPGAKRAQDAAAVRQSDDRSVHRAT